MDDVLALAVIVALLVMLVAEHMVWRLAFRELKRRYDHGLKMATGSYKVVMPVKEWDEAFKQNAFAVAVKDVKTGNVAFTVMVVKEQK